MTDPSRKPALDEILRSIPPETLGKLARCLSEYMDDCVSEALETLRSLEDAPGGAPGITVAVSYAASHLAREHGMQPYEVQLMGLGLFKLAIDAIGGREDQHSQPGR